MSTYKETVFRYRVLRHEDLPEFHKAAYRAKGIDPDDNWSLIWSFMTKEAALACLKQERAGAPSFYTYEMVDGGQSEIIER